MLMRYFVLVILSLSLASGRLTIFKGKLLDSTDDYPWVAVITSNRGTCTGSLVGSDKILTAGHCVLEKEKVSQYYVFLGRCKVDHRAKHYNVIAVEIAEGYTKFSSVDGHDMAILTLDRKAALSDWIKIGKMDYGLVAPGTKLTFIGYGEDKSVNDSGKLREAFVESSKCPESIMEQKHNPICVDLKGAEFQKAGGGDSGGPLMLRESKLIVGVVSGEKNFRSDGSQMIRAIDIFAGTYENRKFIEENL